MSMNKIKQSVSKFGFVKIRYTVNGNHDYKKYSCPYMAFSQCIDMMDAGMNPIVSN